MTVEPGIYIAPGSPCPARFHGIGIRIEDNIVITSSGNRVLTDDVPKTIVAIEALMAQS
jgi:Xaa-Pro aminopeptidase